jgi:hypothetical protein
MPSAPEDYRLNAKACLKMANTTPQGINKTWFEQLAEQWLRMAELDVALGGCPQRTFLSGGVCCRVTTTRITPSCCWFNSMHRQKDSPGEGAKESVVWLDVGQGWAASLIPVVDRGRIPVPHV